MKSILICILLAALVQSSFAQGTGNTSFPKQIIMANDLPSKQNVWVFLMAGQSNMAGRGTVEPSDTIPDTRILTINQNNEIVVAKEPLHYYEPTRTGLDCGLSFARALLKSLPDNVSILLVPAAVGGSSIQQWIGDSTWRDVKLLSNAKEKMMIASKAGVFKGILWHQGEANANTVDDIGKHAARLRILISMLRDIAGNKTLPFLMGELGSFSDNAELFQKLNEQLKAYSNTDKNSAVIGTSDLPHKGDNLHFNSEAQRRMGERFAQTFVSQFLPNAKR
jgi:hypothetical protein